MGEERQECDCCGYATENLERYDRPPGSPFKGRPGYAEHRMLCDLCASTLAETYSEYQNAHAGAAVDLMKVVCYVGNAILEELRRKT